DGRQDPGSLDGLRPRRRQRRRGVPLCLYFAGNLLGAGRRNDQICRGSDGRPRQAQGQEDWPRLYRHCLRQGADSDARKAVAETRLHLPQIPDFGTRDRAVGDLAAGGVKDIRKSVDGRKGGSTTRDKVGEVLFNRGVINAIYDLESIRTAQAKFGKKPLKGEDVQWGYEHLDITPQRITELGADG